MTEIAEDRDLLEERVRYAQLFELAPFPYLLTDFAGSVLEANRAAATLFGISTNAFIGKPIAIFVPLQHRKQFRRTLLGLAHGTASAEWELELEGRPDRRFHALLNAAPLGGGLRWTIQDITERVESELRLRTLMSALEERVLERTEELEQERVRLIAVVDQFPSGLVVAEAPSGRILRVNERARAVVGPFEPGATPDLGDSPLARALEGDVVDGERVETTTPSGEGLIFEVSAGPVRDRAGRIIAAVSTFEDITAREVRQRAEREFVTNAAHELQTPLAAITSAIEVLQAGAKDSAERDLFMEHIEREAQRLDRLTRALLTLSRTQSGVEPPRVELIELCPLLELIAERLEPAPGVEVIVSCARDLAVFTNRELLEQAISNIAKNSVKYTEQGSIKLAGTRRGEEVAISVVDTGLGIPEESLPRVTERFYRGESSRSGFGLGLAIVRATMSVLGGELEIDSSVGSGTTVTMKLPPPRRRGG
jgi:two-component system, sensor histidine kinase